VTVIPLAIWLGQACRSGPQSIWWSEGRPARRVRMAWVSALEMVGNCACRRIPRRLPGQRSARQPSPGGRHHGWPDTGGNAVYRDLAAAPPHLIVAAITVVWLLPPVPRSGPDSADRACAAKTSGLACFPCSVRPVRIRPAQPALSAPCRTSGVPGTRRAVRRYIGVTRPGRRKRADPAWPSMRHAQRGARHSGPRPRNGNRMRCRHDSRTAAGGTTRRQPPRAARAREFPEIHPPAQAPPPAADRNASPPLPSWHTGQPRYSRP
jgi:hypothetical protein